jgi:hypothetical protein
MQIHTLDKANLVNELQCGPTLNQAVEQGRRADFALLLSMFSADCRETIPVTGDLEASIDEEGLKRRFAVADKQKLTGDLEDYPRSASLADGFHQGGLASAKLRHYLLPEPLSYQPVHTFGLPEEVYQNLSGHTRRQLETPTVRPKAPDHLYNELVTSSRKSQFSFTI